MAHVNNFSSNLVEHVDFSDSRVALLWAGFLFFFFLMYNIELVSVCLVPKISQVMMKWLRRASHLGRFFCGTMAAELHSSVDLLCDTKAAELNPV